MEAPRRERLFAANVPRFVEFVLLLHLFDCGLFSRGQQLPVATITQFSDRRQPAWLSNRHALPFQDLSDDEFEVFSYLLLIRERLGEQVIYYGKTGDAGRDVVRTEPAGTVELIQCKRYTSNVGIDEVRGELAKLCTNIHRKLIPVPPARVAFYAVPDLTAPAKDLLGNRAKWLAVCEKALEDHLGQKPPAELVEFAKAWWPAFEHHDEHKLTERARKQPDLIEEFFLVRQVVTGSLAELEPRLAGVEQSVAAMRTRFEEVAGAPPSAPTPGTTGTTTAGTQSLQVRMLAAKVSTLEDRDRQHLDAEGQRLIVEIQGAVRALDLRQAVSAGPLAEHTVMTAAISGRPARCLANRFTALGASVPVAAMPDYPIAYDAGKALHAAARARGEFGYGAQWAGQGAPLARALPAAELVARLKEEMEQARLPG
jgi:hypothetical protein